MLRNVAEAIAYGLAIAFLYLVWAPLALLGGAVLLWVWANFTRPSKGLAAAVGASAGAAYRAWKSAKATP